MEQTSIESYDILVSSGMLSERLTGDLTYILSQPVGTRIIARRIPKCGWKRCYLLEAMGLIRKDGEVYDQETERNVIAWVPTGIPANLVESPQRKPSRKVLLQHLLSLELQLELAQAHIKALQDAQNCAKITP
jgi:hypothetical protein